MASEVREDVVGLPNEVRRGFGEALAQLVHRVGDVAPRGGGGVHQAANALLHLAHQLRVLALGLRHSLAVVLEERGGVGQRVALHAVRDAVGQEPRDYLLDVLALVQGDRAVAVALDLDPEEVVHRSLVHYLPVGGELVDERVVLAALRPAAVGAKLGRVHDLQVIHVNADLDDLAVGVRPREHAGVGVVERLEALVAQPGEELALQAPAGLLDAVDRFLDASHHGPPLGVELLVTWRQVAEDHLALEEGALQVRGD